ncbi:MAG: hypothetical protein R3350_01405 [Saprospiraceae bacterium]|nr:hypothetical protein [Saprospiraceae bacterium]
MNFRDDWPALIIAGLAISIVWCLLLAGPEQKPLSPTVKSLKEQNMTSRSLYFYPSTLRMIIKEEGSSLTQLIKDLRMLVINVMDTEDFTPRVYRESLKSLTANEEFEEYVRIEGTDGRWYVLGKGHPDHLVILTQMDSSAYVTEIRGELDLSYFPDLIQNFTDRDAPIQDSFIDIFSLTQ